MKRTREAPGAGVASVLNMTLSSNLSSWYFPPCLALERDSVVMRIAQMPFLPATAGSFFLRRVGSALYSDLARILHCSMLSLHDRPRNLLKDLVHLTSRTEVHWRSVGFFNLQKV